MTVGSYWWSGWTMTTMSAPALEGRPVAGLLVAAVAAVLRVLDDVEAQAARFLDRAVARGVVHEDHVVHGVPCGMSAYVRASVFSAL